MNADSALPAVDLAHEADFALGSLLVRPSIREVESSGRVERLEPRVMQALVALARQRNRVLSRDDLIAICWDGVIVGDHAINRVMSKIRRLLEAHPGAGCHLETVPRVGYRLHDRATEAPDATAILASNGFARALRALATRRDILLLCSLAGASAAAALWPRAKARARTPRLAILPFDNLGATPSYFSEGLAEELITLLARVPGLEVVGRASSFALPPGRNDPTTVHEVLGATLVLTGAVSMRGDGVRVTVQLLDAPSGAGLWSDAFERPLEEIYQLQGDVAMRIAQAVQLRAAATSPRRVDGEAFRLYLLGREAELRAADSVASEAEALYRLAVARDPRFAEAQAALSNIVYHNASWTWLSEPQGTLFDRDRLREADAVADRAIVLNPSLALPYSVKARVAGALGEWSASDRAIAACIARSGYPIWPLLQLGRLREASDLAQQDAALSPLDPYPASRLCETLRLRGDFVAAIAAGERAFALGPSPDSLHNLLVVLIEAGQASRAQEIMAERPDLLTTALQIHAPQTVEYLRYAIGAGPAPSASAIVERIRAGRGYADQAAIMLADLGALDKAGEMLDLVGEADLPVIWTVFDARCAALRSLPQFWGLMRRIGLAAFWRSSGKWPDFCSAPCPALR